LEQGFATPKQLFSLNDKNRFKKDGFADGTEKLKMNETKWSLSR